MDSSEGRWASVFITFIEELAVGEKRLKVAKAWVFQVRVMGCASVSWRKVSALSACIMCCGSLFQSQLVRGKYEGLQESVLVCYVAYFSAVFGWCK